MRFRKPKTFALRDFVLSAVPEPASIEAAEEDDSTDNKPCLINKLPPEILAYIFTLGTQMQLSREAYSYAEDMVETAVGL